MCTIPPQTEKNIGRPAEVVGLNCPLCSDPSILGYMRFLDPHGVERVEANLFECAPRRHSFTLGKGVLRLLASDGTRPRERREFRLQDNRLVEAGASA